MAIMIAIAAVDTGQDALAMDRYLYSLRTLQDRIAVAADAGNEDAFLATTVCLCVFEVSCHRSSPMPDMAPLIRAEASKESPIRCTPKYRAACEGSRCASFPEKPRTHCPVAIAVYRSV